MTDDPKRNPGWKRPPDWKFEEDWNSPAWKERMRQSNIQLALLREAFGFEVCPACGVEHTIKTLVCRECGHKAPRPDDDPA
jgi:predicted RNA-binding Zn-ribbon protein involved in translation (DUF1610 family)